MLNQLNNKIIRKKTHEFGGLSILKKGHNIESKP